MKLTTSLVILSMLTLSLPACVAGGPDDPDNGLVGQAEQDGAVGTAEQDGAVGTAEQDGAVGTAEQDGAVGTAEQALTCTQLYIWHYTYVDGSGTFKWDVTFNTGNSKWYVDEKRIGGGFYKQYILTPDWDQWLCYLINPTESIALKNSGITMSGTRTCLPDHREEIQMPDKQRLLTFGSFTSPCVE